MAAKDKKYYWLKLKRDFFKRHDIQIIEDMPNGKDYILFYLKLLCESVDHDGNLRFSDEIPYNEQMLSTITRTNVDVVRSAIKVFESLKMMEILDDGTFYMNEVNKMLGSETYWAERKRIQDSRKKEEALECVGNFPTTPSKSKSKILDKEKDKDKENIKEIFDCWNNQNIIKHRNLTTDISNEIKKALKKYDAQIIKDCITRYGEMFNSDYEYCNYSWALKIFLSRKEGISEFMDEGSKWNNYLNWKNGSNKQSKQKEDNQPELDFSRFTV